MARDAQKLIRNVAIGWKRKLYSRVESGKRVTFHFIKIQPEFQKSEWIHSPLGCGTCTWGFSNSRKQYPRLRIMIVLHDFYTCYFFFFFLGIEWMEKGKGGTVENPTFDILILKRKICWLMVLVLTSFLIPRQGILVG